MAQLATEVAPELRATLEQARKTLGSAEQVLASDSPVQGDLRETLLEVTQGGRVGALADRLPGAPPRVADPRQARGDDTK